MQKSQSPMKMNEQIYEEASEWLVRQHTGTLMDADKRGFDAWLRRSPDHVRAYLEMSSTWEDTSLLAGAADESPAELIRRAQTTDTVIPLTSSPANSWGGLRRGRHLPLKIAASITAAAMLTAAGVYFSSNSSPTYVTAIGEQRSLVLKDGSTVQLNSRSRIRVDLTGTLRSVELLEGQALFNVAKQTTRPFIVTSGGTQVRVLGTQFDVYRKHTGTVVTVLEGKVEIADGRATTRAAAGEQVVAAQKALTKPPRPNLAAATSWTQRSLIFDSEPLAAVAEEFNRYNTRPLIVEDASLAQLRVSGVFSSVDPHLLLKFLRAQPEVAVSETDKDIRITRR